MTHDPGTFVGDPPRTRWHRAWVVAAVTLGALVAAAAFRSSTGVLLEPIEAEFGWSRAVTSGAVSLNLVLYGLTAPSLPPSWSASGCGTPSPSPWSSSESRVA